MTSFVCGGVFIHNLTVLLPTTGQAWAWGHSPHWVLGELETHHLLGGQRGLLWHLWAGQRG